MYTLKITANSYAAMMEGVKESTEERGEYDAMEVVRFEGVWEARLYFDVDEDKDDDIKFIPFTPETLH